MAQYYGNGHVSIRFPADDDAAFNANANTVVSPTNANALVSYVRATVTAKLG